MEAQPIVYKPHGVCCSRISDEIRDNRLFNVRFEGGCNGKGRPGCLKACRRQRQKNA